MLEKFYSEASSGRGAFYKSRDVGENMAVKITEVRSQRRERIVAHFRLGPRESVEERGLPRIRQADKPGVRDYLKGQFYIPALAALADGSFKGILIRRTLKARITQSPFPATEQDDAFALFRNLILLACLPDARERANRHLQKGIRAICAVLQFILPGPAVLRMKFFLIAIVGECRYIAHANQDDIAALSAVAARGSAARGLLGTQPADNTVAALPRLRMYLRFINKCHKSVHSTLENINDQPASTHEPRTLSPSHLRHGVS